MTGPAGDPEHSRLPIPLANMGLGPALDVVIELSSSQVGVEQELIRQPALAVGAHLVVELNTFGGQGAPPFDLMITYADVAGDRYSVAASWNTDEHRYDDIQIAAVASWGETRYLGCNHDRSVG